MLPSLGLASVIQTNHTPLDGSCRSNVPALSKVMSGDFPPAAQCQVQKPKKSEFSGAIKGEFQCPSPAAKVRLSRLLPHTG